MKDLGWRDNDGKKVRINKLHKRMFDAIQLKCAAAQLKRAAEILAVDPKGHRALYCPTWRRGHANR